MVRSSSDEVLKLHSVKILGYLIRLIGNFDDAEDLHQEVMLIAVQNWEEKQLPAEPLAWLFTVARNKATDYLRHKKIGNRVALQLKLEPNHNESLERYLNDDLLRLIFTCCHPALDPEVRVALTLKTVVGLSLEEVARAFLVSDKTMQQRLVRVKRKIRMAGIAYEIPGSKQLLGRLGSVLQTIYLLFNEGYSATGGDELVRKPLCHEAIRLAHLMDELFPGHAELEGILSLMLLQDSRREARLSGSGDLVLLRDQDRSRWDKAQIEAGRVLLEHALHLHQPPGQYQIQAAIAAIHADAASADDTDWQEIVLLYESLLKHNHSPVVRLNYAVALAFSGKLEQAMSQMSLITDRLQQYHPFYIALAELHLMKEQGSKAIEDFEKALLLTRNQQEKAFITLRLQGLRI